MLTVSAEKVRAGVGSSVTVYGGIFGVSTTIYINGKTQTPIDVTENSVTFSAPAQAGNYSFVISSGATASKTITLVVVPVEELAAYKLPERGAEAFENMQVGMMPRGVIFNPVKGTFWRKLIDSVAVCLLYLYNLLKSIVAEGSPIKTTRLGLWENELALPKKGLVQTSSEGRRKEIIRISRGTAGATVPYLKQMLDLYGADYELYEYWKNPAPFPGWVGRLDNKENVFCVLIKVYRDKLYYGFTCNSKCNESLGCERDRILESIMENEKPAHVKLVYSYYCRILTDEQENALTDEDGKLLIV